MSARSWKYGEDARGRELIEELTAQQGYADDAILRDFNTLEGNIFNGKPINDEYSKKVIASIQERVETLPTHRALHWVNELERIGAIVKAPAKPAAPAKDSKESTGGAK